MRTWRCISIAILVSCAQFSVPSFAQDENRFDNYEIRVIRPRFFQKTGRFELGAELNTIMNNTFVYTFLASGLMTYHFSESFGVEASLAYGFSIDRKEKEILRDDYEIKTEVFRTQYVGELALLYTPIYGKVQLPEGRLVYFDTFLAFGAGMTGVEWRYSDMCVPPNREYDTSTPDAPADKTVSYPNLVYGVGQRIFRNRKTSLRWDVRGHTIFYKSGDASCNPEEAGQGSDTRTSITLQLGGSQFF